MKKMILLFFLVFSFSGKSQVNISYIGAFYNYSNCVTEEEGGLYVLDTLCPDLLEVEAFTMSDVNYIFDPYNYIHFFRNLKKISISMLDFYPEDSLLLMFPHLEEIYMMGCRFHSNMPLYLPPTLKKITVYGIDSGFRVPVIPNGLEDFALLYVNDTTHVFQDYFPNVPDSLKKFRYIGYETSTNPYDVDLNFENAVNLKSFELNNSNLPIFNLLHFPVFNSSASLDELSVLGYHIDTIQAIPASLREFHFSSDSTAYIDAFPPNLQKLTFNTQIDCIPELPSTLLELEANGNFCFPNYIPGLGIEDRLCSNPVNNLNGCNALNTIRGTVYRDLNSNCSYDLNTDILLNNIPVNLFDGSANFIATIYSQDGTYGFSVEDGAYKIVLDTLETTLRRSCGGQAYEYTVNVGPGISETIRDFELKCDTLSIEELNGIDLSMIQVLQSDFFFPGLSNDLCLFSGNILYEEQLACLSAENLLDSTMHFEIRITGPVSFTDVSSLYETQVVNDTLIVSYDYTLENTSSFYSFCFSLLTDSTAQIGDEVCVTASVMLDGGELDLTNNILVRCFQVVNSYDPNMKETYPAHMQPGFDDEIRYTIHFQNTGNAPAINIQLIDTLDQKLDPATFRVVHASHDVLPALNGNRLLFKFANINLADSLSDPEGSKGYVEYAIRPVNPMQLDEKIYNTAYIYFDFNEPIITNTSENWCTTDVLGLKETKQGKDPVVYPNPLGAERMLRLRKKDEGPLPVSIFDLNGTEVGRYVLNGSQNELDLKNLKAGVYILKSESGTGTLTQKLVLL